MPTDLPCPNPSCEHTFTAEQVKGVTMLRCPACGTVFKFGAGAPVPAAARAATVPLVKPVASRPGTPPVARPVALPPSVARSSTSTPLDPEILPDTMVISEDVTPRPAALPPAAAPAAGFADDLGGAPLIRPRYQQRGAGWPLYAALGGALLIIAVVIVIVVVSQRSASETPDKKSAEKKAPTGKTIDGSIKSGDKFERVYRLTLADKSWEHEHALRDRFGGNIALRRKDTATWLVIVVKDFGTARPRDAEMIAAAKERLEDVFDNTLELGDQVQKIEFVGQPAQRLVFKAKLDSASCRGECWMLTQRGLGYWIYLIAASAETAQKELARVQDMFVLVDERGAWREKPAQLETFTGNKLPVTLQAPEGVWEKFPPLDEEARIDLYLAGKYLKEKDNRKNASAMLLALDKQADTKEAMKAARDFVDKSKKAEYKDAMLALAGGDEIPEQGELGTLSKFGNRHGRLVELRLQDKDQPLRYLMLAVIAEPDRTIAVVCECSWDNRLIWREDFRDLLSTLQVKSD